jgi:hypothetical protein
MRDISSENMNPGPFKTIRNIFIFTLLALLISTLHNFKNTYMFSLLALFTYVLYYLHTIVTEKHFGGAGDIKLQNLLNKLHDEVRRDK